MYLFSYVQANVANIHLHGIVIGKSMKCLLPGQTFIKCCLILQRRENRAKIILH